MAAKKKKKGTKNRSKSKPSASARKTVKRKTVKKAGGHPKRRTREKQNAARLVARSSSTRSGEQSGDLQGLSWRERADSESVDELLEEGNAFEAGVISGVEEADDADEREVHTREVPEDDVPGEYLDKDS